MIEQKIIIYNKYNKLNSFQLEITNIIILDGSITISHRSMLKNNKAAGIYVSVCYVGYNT